MCSLYLCAWICIKLPLFWSFIEWLRQILLHSSHGKRTWNRWLRNIFSFFIPWIMIRVDLLNHQSLYINNVQPHESTLTLIENIKRYNIYLHFTSTILSLQCTRLRVEHNNHGSIKHVRFQCCCFGQVKWFARHNWPVIISCN